MCGRFTLTLEIPALQQELGIKEVPADWQPRYNIAPSQPIPVVIDSEARRIEMLRWGLIPYWAKDASIGNKMINARAETIAEKPAYRSAFERRRCLIVANGFYEWKKQSHGPAIPHFYYREGEKPFAFAGLWENWVDPKGEKVRTCTIITCEANELVRAVHPRMPVMLTGDDLWRWLEGESKTELIKLLAPYEKGDLNVRQVSTLVNRSESEGGALIHPVDG
ncbi:MAG TPA: SOS response-associated peptidase [Levilinea sp.]|nr:SOS response-associated peptidase [Levilinea sp.]